MLCYKDMTFCGFYNNCKSGSGCHRALTMKVQSEANAFNLPISLFTEAPECYKEIDENKTKEIVAHYQEMIDNASR